MQAVQPVTAATPGTGVTVTSNSNSTGGGGGPQPAGLPTALSSFRYAPYPMPVSAAAAQAVQQAAALAAHHQQAAAAQQSAVAGAGAPQTTTTAPVAQQTSGQQTALTSLPTVSLATLANGQAALQTFAQSGSAAGHVIPSVTAGGGLSAPGVATNSPIVGNPYSGYSLTNVDMSSFQGVDWSSIYGMGMYV